MSSIKDFFKSFKPAHLVYNVFHRKQLEHNRIPYQKYGIKKPLFWFISSQDFKGLPQQPKWVDGSGLSRYNLFSPNDFIWLLNKMKNEMGMKRLKIIWYKHSMLTKIRSV